VHAFDVAVEGEVDLVVVQGRDQIWELVEEERR
jgi:hypothetical protein